MSHQGTDFSIFSYVDIGNFAFLGIFPFHSYFQIYWHKFVHYFLLPFWNLHDLQYCPSFYYCIDYFLPFLFFLYQYYQFCWSFQRTNFGFVLTSITFLFLFCISLISLLLFIISFFLLTLGFIYCQSHLLHFLLPSLYFQFQNFHSNPF